MYRVAIGSLMAAAVVFGGSCQPPMAAVTCAGDSDCLVGWHCDPVRKFCYAIANAGTVDAAVPDAAVADAAITDAAITDATVLDAAAIDDIAPDATLTDLAAPDTNGLDAHPPDVWLLDALAAERGGPDRPGADRQAADAGACKFVALVFDGVDDRVSVADQTGMDSLAKMTLEVWIKQTGSTNAQRIFSRHKSNTYTGYTLSIVSGRPQFEVSCLSCSGMVAVNANGVVATGSWHHLAGVVDATHAMLFVDGVKQTQVQPWAGPTTAGYDFGAYLGGGVASTDAFAFPFNGAIDSVRLTGTNRYTEDFTPLRGPLARDQDTVALWNLEEGEGQIAGDATGVHDGLLGGTANQEAADPTWRSAMCAEDG